ncbi:uncharacterized protein LOC105210378 [Zeugodacus cucurbitae]|uniref:uncharacterized protein LOC105210378 n=1 Tax=Zeugodacus cucurbitae TaxID=28588 RepID=UPI000596930E|nr:uncharacterized protein LOC105210378 [Zeugodacus cucurbitae]XP_011179586.1 uncharacterized protein LOC105210378 [Zeugodacus cucurbitae]XP_011179587.1 uncharacterized protein LOC105210378 [Zeugodacus cucurbitae]XP_054084405.1 uncharacterized protein LOC105210378 [Zeugodacus cucurbitae]
MSYSPFQTTETGNWTDLPLHCVLYEWLTKNMNLPNDYGTIIAYIGLFLITWYTIIWAVRLVMAVIWPLFIIASAIVVFRILQFYDPEEITTIMMKSFSIIADTLVMILAKLLEFAFDIFD